MRIRTRKWELELSAFGWQWSLGLASASSFNHVGILWEPLIEGCCAWIGVGHVAMIFVSWWSMSDYERYFA